MGAVVAGAIMLVNGGAKARGALLRDVAALGLAVCTITAFLSAGAMSYARGGGAAGGVCGLCAHRPRRRPLAHLHEVSCSA